MTDLDKAIALAYEHEGESEYANKVYALFFRSMLFMPVETFDDPDEPFTPWIFEWKDQFFIPVFSTLPELETWAEEQEMELEYVSISGADLVRGVATEQVYLCLNPDTDHYKEFAPDEVERLKAMLAKIEQLKNAANAIEGED